MQNTTKEATELWETRYKVAKVVELLYEEADAITLTSVSKEKDKSLFNQGYSKMYKRNGTYLYNKKCRVWLTLEADGVVGMFNICWYMKSVYNTLSPYHINRFMEDVESNKINLFMRDDGTQFRIISN